MAGLPMKEVVRIAKHVEAQGVNITRTKKGLLLRMPDGETAMMHFTSSDVNAIKKLRAELHRSGVTLPNDRHDLATLPAYARHNPVPKNIERVRVILEELGNPQQVQPKDVTALYAERHQVNPNGIAATVVSAMHRLGYYPHQSPSQLKRGATSGRTAYKYWERDLSDAELAEAMPEQAVPADAPAPKRVGSWSHQLYELLATSGRPWTVAELRAELDGVNESTLSSVLNSLKDRGMIERIAPATYALPLVQPVAEEPSQVSPAENDSQLAESATELEPREPVTIESVRQGMAGMAAALTIVPDEPAAREFIDSVDSWPVSLQALDPATTVGQLLAIYQVTGLAVELRAWRA